MQRRAIHSLVEFSRLAARGAPPGEVLPALCALAQEQLGVDAAAVVDVCASGEARLVASVGLPPSASEFDLDDDLVGPEIAEALRAALAPSFVRADAVPLVSAGGVFGTLVLLFREDRQLDADQRVLLEGFVDMAATSLSATQQYAELARSYAELRASRAALEKGEKLRALGQMAASVTHDLKNILHPLGLHLQFLKRALQKDQVDALDSVVEMQGVLRRGAQTIERLSDFSRQTPTTKAELSDLNVLAEEAIAIGRTRSRTRHDVHYQLVEQLGSPPRVLLASGECVAALVNLVVNAVDAMPGGGTITISSGADDDGAWIRVADDGPGMPADVERRVFEPFFSTKGDAGTGLGLAMVYAFAQRHRGRVTLKTAPGEGAAFTLHLPAAPT